jgi:hypothetical protein
LRNGLHNDTLISRGVRKRNNAQQNEDDCSHSVTTPVQRNRFSIALCSAWDRKKLLNIELKLIVNCMT